MFDSKFNVFIGGSNTGKTSCIRALAVVGFNKWEPGMLMIGEKRAEIILETEKGIVHVFKGDLNDYIVTEFLEKGNKEYKFENVNKTTPEIVAKITGLGKLDVQGVEDYPNFMFQLDGHYMLSEINGKNCSSNTVAKIMDNVIGLGGAEELINDVAADGQQSKRKLTVNQNRITELKCELHDKDELEIKKSRLKDVNTQNEILIERQAIQTEYSSVMKNKKILSEKLDNINISLKSEIDLEKALETQTILNSNKLKFDETNKLNEENIKLNGKMAIINTKLNDIPNTLVVSSELSELKIEKLKYSNIFSLYSSLQLKELKLKKIKKELSKIVVVITENKSELLKIKKENPNCPLCDKPWTNKKKNKKKIEQKIEQEIEQETLF